MKPSSVFGLALLLSVASAAVTTMFLSAQPRPEAHGRDVPGPTGLDDLVRRQNDLEASVAELRANRASPIEPARSSPREPVIDESAIERAVARVLEQRERSSVPAGMSTRAGATHDALAASALLRELLAHGIDDAERARIWQELRDSGQIDAAVAEFERRAQAAPLDPVAQTELGWAYFQKIATTGGGPEAGRWGAKGAAALERALELDDTNWDARYTLAQHFNDAEMRGDSIRHLERLVQQQGDRVSEPKHANAYVFLGSLHMDSGRSDAAKEVWNAGLRLFPGNAALEDRLRAFE